MMNLSIREVPDRISRAIVLIRLLVGAVFLSEGIQKFLFSGALDYQNLDLPGERVLGNGTRITYRLVDAPWVDLPRSRGRRSLERRCVALKKEWRAKVGRGS
jgi:hypothetical protein